MGGGASPAPGRSSGLAHRAQALDALDPLRTPARLAPGGVRCPRGARLLPGKKVLNVIPAAFPNKGDAVRTILRRLRLDRAIFLGDDLTDEDVFRIGPPHVVGVRVGPGRSAAPWRLAGQVDVDELLARLVDLREPAWSSRRKKT
jgi:trehalose-6-phosphatase